MATVGIVCALPEEAAALLGHKPPFRQPVPWEGALVVVCGAGAANAHRAATALLAAVPGIRGLVSFGTAGGLDPALAPGSLMVPARAFAADLSELYLDVGWAAQLRSRISPCLPVANAPLVSAVAPVVTVAAKATLAARSGAAAVDMETEAIARVAAVHGIPLVVVRAIVDTAAVSLPAPVLLALDEAGRVRVLRFLLALARQPGEVLAVYRLARAFAAATATLKRVGGLAPDLLSLA